MPLYETLRAITTDYWYGVTAGGACNAVVTSTGAGLTFSVVAVRTISGQTSNTPTTTCTFAGNSGLGTKSCTSALTVPSNGVAGDGSYGTTTCTNMTTYQNDNGDAFCHSTTAGSLTPTISTGASGNMGIAGATWH